MTQTFAILLAATMLAVLGVLILGVVSMVRGGEFNRKYGNRFMRLRVVLQGIALALFAALMLSSR